MVTVTDGPYLTLDEHQRQTYDGYIASGELYVDHKSTLTLQPGMPVPRGVLINSTLDLQGDLKVLAPAGDDQDFYITRLIDANLVVSPDSQFEVSNIDLDAASVTMSSGGKLRAEGLTLRNSEVLNTQNNQQFFGPTATHATITGDTKMNVVMINNHALGASKINDCVLKNFNLDVSGKHQTTFDNIEQSDAILKINHDDQPTIMFAKNSDLMAYSQPPLNLDLSDLNEQTKERPL